MVKTYNALFSMDSGVAQLWNCIIKNKIKNKKHNILLSNG